MTEEERKSLKDVLVEFVHILRAVIEQDLVAASQRLNQFLFDPSGRFIWPPKTVLEVLQESDEDKPRAKEKIIQVKNWLVAQRLEAASRIDEIDEALEKINEELRQHE